MAVLNAILSRRWLFVAAWVLLLASVLVPAPAGFYPIGSGVAGIKFLGDDILGGTTGLSGMWVIGKAFDWSRQPSGAVAALGFWHVAVLTLAFFANVAFLFCLFLQDYRRVSLACRILLVAAVGVGASAALMFPVFLLLPAYWMWLTALGVLAWSFLAFEGSGSTRRIAFAKRAETDTGDVPLVAWMWLAFVAFWLAVTYIGASRLTATAGTEPRNDIPTAKALESYFNDQANLVAADKAAKLNAALAAFEKDTSNQIAVAIYPRLPSGSIEDFTIATAEKSRLGRKGLDNGAILFVFMNERSARLEVGYGLEGALTDIASHRILEQRLEPAFAQGHYDEGLDATLGAVFDTVRDGYGQGQMPGKLAVMWRQVVVALPGLVHQALPALMGLGFLPRFISSFFGGVFATIACYVVREIVRDLYYMGRMAKNFVAPRPGVKIERVGFDAMLEKLKLMGFALEVIVGATGFALAAIAGVAGIVIIAAGGGFGGAGAMVRW